jgi:site-specific recombinase XerD
MSLPFPIFSTQSEVKEFIKVNNGSDGKVGINNFYDSHEYMATDYYAAAAYLMNWGVAKNQTYNAYRNDIEKLMLWCWIERKISILNLTKSDYSAFLDFCNSPPESWIMTHRYSKYTGKSLAAYGDIDSKTKSYYESRAINYNGSPINPLWRPFLASDNGNSSKLSRTASEQTLTRQRRVLSSFYNHLLDEDLITSNPITSINKIRSGVIDTRKGKMATQRLSGETWRCMLETLENKALENPVFERTLFVIVLMKSCFLRISEISAIKTERGLRTPLMKDIVLLNSHTTEDGPSESVWYIEVHGKGSKLRSVSIPDALISYIERYRASRGLKGDMPTQRSVEPLIHKQRGSGGVTAKQAARIVQEGFDYFIAVMKEAGRHEMAKEAEQASTHWLRHTGASMSAESIGILNLSQEMGHTDPSLTARMYLHTDEHERAMAGRKRKL